MEPSYPRSPADVVATLSEFYDHSQDKDLPEVLRSAEPTVEYSNYDNWNGGMHFYTLHLKIPVGMFAKIEPRLELVQKNIEDKLGKLFRDDESRVLSAVVFSATSSMVMPKMRLSRPDDGKSADLWEDGFVRLFLSHVSQHKVKVAELKRELSHLGVSSFVAHEDIEPTLEWQNEIERALMSTDALAALLTPEFHESKWTDQEIGFALGRGTLVIPIRLGLLPYGFIGKQQALPGDLDKPALLASSIVESLRHHPQMEKKLREAFVVALEKAPSYAAARAVSYKIVATKGFTDAQLGRIEKACSHNRQVKESTNVVPRLSNFVENLRPKPAKTTADDSDDVPF